MKKLYIFLFLLFLLLEPCLSQGLSPKKDLTKYIQNLKIDITILKNQTQSSGKLILDLQLTINNLEKSLQIAKNLSKEQEILLQDSKMKLEIQQTQLLELNSQLEQLNKLLSSYQNKVEFWHGVSIGLGVVIVTETIILFITR